MRYLGDRAQKIAEEAAKSNSVFSVDDRIGLVYDTKALAEAGYIKASRPLNLALILSRKETECESTAYSAALFLERQRY